MKKIVFTAIVLATVLGVSGSAQAFWGFSKKANKVEVKNEQAEEGMAISALSISGGTETGKLHINKTKEGFSLLAGGAKVISNTAGVLTTEILFGTSKIGLTVKTNADTKVFRHYGGKGVAFGVSDIAVNDILSVEGDLEITAGSLTIMAKKVQDYSAQARNADYSGTIKTITATSDNAGTFVLDLSNNERDLTVVVNASTIIHKFVKKGQTESLAPVLFNTLKVGDVVKNATGIVNTQTMQMTAKKVVVSERDVQTRKIKDVFAEVVSVDSGNSMRVKTTAGVEYIVSLKETNTVYNKWIISKKYSGVKKGTKTDGETTLSSLSELAFISTNKVWVSGELDTKTGVVVPSLIEKEFYR